MTPRFTVITPTLLRESLMAACNSLDGQSFTDWQHVICVDGVNGSFPFPEPGKRDLMFCHMRHNNFGNTCRFLAWEQALGDYILHLDDDNTLLDEHVLRDIDAALRSAGDPPWALFPILRHGQRFFTDPPRSCHVDTANVVVKREIGRWPNRDEYTADGIWVEALVRDHPYVAFPGFRPIVVMPQSSLGR